MQKYRFSMRFKRLSFYFDTYFLKSINHLRIFLLNQFFFRNFQELSC